MIRTDRTLVCWGGDWGEEVHRAVPRGAFRAVDDGCAIRRNGRLACWGWVWTEDMGDSGGRPTVLPAPTGTFTAVDGNCAIRTNGTLACWYGQDEGGYPRLKMKRVPDGTFSAVSAGESEACAIRTDGTLVCWGRGGGSGWAGPEGTFTAIGHPCAIRTDGTLVCWGSGVLKQVPDGTFTAVSTAASLYGAESRACAIRTDGTLACWGDPYSILGEYDQEPTPLAVPDGTFTAVSMSDDEACAQRTDGTVVCWGESDSRPAPSASIRLPSPWLATTKIPIRWSATPLLAPIASYSVRHTSTRWDNMDISFDSQAEVTNWLTETTATSGTFKGRPGYTYCFEATATDTDGVRSNGAGSCTTIPLDDRSLARSAGWSKLSGSRFYRSTALRSSTRGASLTLAGFEAPSIALLATTCPTCGIVGAYIDGAEVARVNLRSSRTVDRRFFTVYLDDCEMEEACHGTLTIKVISRGKPVIIDGVVVGRAAWG